MPGSTFIQVFDKISSNAKTILKQVPESLCRNRKVTKIVIMLYFSFFLKTCKLSVSKLLITSEN